MLTLLIGPSGTGKSELLLRRASRPTGERQVLLVPEPQSHETERRLCRVGGNQVCLHAEVLTFSRLSTRIFQAAGGLGRAELDGGGRLLLMYRAVQGVAEQLTVYARPSRRPAFLTGLLDTADELKSCCVAPRELIRAGEEIGGTAGGRLRDLGLICAAYDALAAQTALDPRDRLTRAAEKLSQCLWARGTTFFLDGFIDFTPQQLSVVELLLQQGEGVTVALTCDHLEEDEDGLGIFSPARRTARQLQTMARRLGQECRVEVLDTPAPGRSPAMTALERNLFASPIQTGECGGDVQLFQAPDPRTEVEWTAAQILKLVREEGLRFRDIGIAARGYERYDALVESVLPRYGVPVFRSAMSDILQKPVLTLVTAALDAVSAGYAYDDMFRYLKTGLTGLSEEERDLLENYVLKWDLHGSRWTQEKPWTMHPRGYGFPLEEEDRLLLERLDALRRRVAAPLEKLGKNRDRTGRGQAMALYAFLEEIGLPRRLEERTARLRREGELGLAEEYRQLWEILCTALEQCAQLMPAVPVELPEFARLLKLVLSRYQVGTIPVSLDRVAAGEMRRQSGHNIQVLFLLGADDASIPSLTPPAGLLSDEDRQTLLAWGLELGEPGEGRLCREMTAVYTACTRPTRRLYVTWSARGAGGEELRASFLVQRLERIFPDLKVQEQGDSAFRLSAPGPALEQAGRFPQVCAALEGLPQWQEPIRRLEQAGSWERGRLSRPTVERLYGSRVAMSASRMDKYKSCHFSYFMRYGLKAEPRRSAGFDAPEYGTFVHYVLEHVLQDEAFQQPDIAWDEERKKTVRELTAQAVERYVKEQLGGLEGQTPRFRYLFRRLLDGVDQVVENVVQELCASRFRPLSFELGFGRGETLPAVELSDAGVTISVTGFVDRVDGWDQGDKLCLRVVDYKTGRKSFDFTEVLSGMGLQMLLYLFTLQREGERLYGKQIVPAGVLYLPARAAIVQGSRTMPEDERRALADKQLRRKGLVLDDEGVLAAMEQVGEQGVRFLPVKQNRAGQLTGEALVSLERFGRLERHVNRVLREICRELAAGNIAADPFWRGPDKNACLFCDYAEACHFEEGRGGDCRRRLAGVSAEEFWEQLEKEEI